MAQHVCRGVTWHNMFVEGYMTTCLYRVTWHNMFAEGYMAQHVCIGLHGTTHLYRVTWHNMFV